MRFRNRLVPWALAALSTLASPVAVAAPGAVPVEHELIQPDPRDDLALQVLLDGDLPAALKTRSGILHAPDPRAPTAPTDAAFGAAGSSLVQSDPDAKFTPDRDTRRPDVSPAVDPFTPSVAPFERLAAFDQVHADYTLGVETSALVSLSPRSDIAHDGSEEQFFANLEVDVRPGARVRIPSVGPDTRVVHAHAGIAGKDVPFRLWKDGADNWFVEGFTRGRIRLVMELTIPRGAFGGEFQLDRWTDVPAISALPLNAQAAAAIVTHHIGVSKAMPPRDVVKKLVGYFRAFVDSKDPPSSTGDMYLDLALSQKGVCRHRAFAFVVTARSMGIPARMAVSENHAWVEVHDARAWRRIDLGGAGNETSEPKPTTHYQPPADPFSWPSNASRGEDLARSSAGSGPDSQNGGGSGGGNGTSSASASAGTSASATPAGSAKPNPSTLENKPDPKDERPSSKLTMIVADTDTRRGGALHVKGEVSADGEKCRNLVVDIFLRDDKHHEVSVGSVATDDKGAYSAAIVVPQNVPIGDYDVLAHTSGDARCGAGISH
ncbi:MAG: transglutaminase-like domain-containing protein [Polyangiaceae bacterium]